MSGGRTAQGSGYTAMWKVQRIQRWRSGAKLPQSSQAQDEAVVQEGEAGKNNSPPSRGHVTGDS
jgi:hypothetical protein